MNVVHGKIFAASCAFLAISLHADQGYARVSPSPRAAEMQRLFECKLIAERAARVDCYDAAVESLGVAERQGEIVVVERERVLEARRALFGFTLPAFPSLLGGQAERLDEVETTLERATYATGPGWTFYLADGSIWTQIDTASLQFRATAGLPVRIRRAAMGSYFLKVADNPAVRAKRQ
ncbi:MULTISPECIES: hypothetical protein [unclassified Brevundimonas]|uniref:hypothetical protein n=1 Tax=unclassified Brevundimonas TaxID=2622653 RepID=UPI003F8FA1A9